MDKLSVVNLSIKENGITRDAALMEMAKSVKKHTGKDLFELLPTQPWHDVKFELKGTYVGFANAIRRVLIEELPVICANVKETSVTTDDEFVKGLMDVLVKNINLLPVRQSLDKEVANKLTIRLDVFNNTNEVMDVTAADFKIVTGKKDKHVAKKGGSKRKTKKSVTGGADGVGESKGTDGGESKGADVDRHAVFEDVTGGTGPVNDIDGTDIRGCGYSGGVTGGADDDIEYDEDKEQDTETKLRPVDSPIGSKSNKQHTPSNTDIEYVFPNPNITIIRLRPMKYLTIEGLEFEVGRGFESFSKFTLLNNVSYHPVDIEPYDIYTNTGTRSIEHDCSHFMLGFTTAGNILPSDVMTKVVTHLKDSLENLKRFIGEYAVVLAADSSKKYYDTKDLSVSKIDDVFHYKFSNQYFTLMNMISQRCFIIDPNILHCSSGVDRYDTRLGIIKIKHADTAKVLMTAIDYCLKDLDVLDDAF